MRLACPPVGDVVVVVDGGVVVGVGVGVVVDGVVVGVIVVDVVVGVIVPCQWLVSVFTIAPWVERVATAAVHGRGKEDDFIGWFYSSRLSTVNCKKW